MEKLPWLLANQWLFGLFVALVLTALAEVGYRIGLRLFAARDEARRSQIGGVQGAVLGMLALLLGFTFSMAVSRFETRRDLVLKEANAIGTAWLRAGMLPETHRAPAKGLLSQYLGVRIHYQKLGDDPAQLAVGLRQSAALQGELWRLAEAAAEVAPTPITAAFVLALNDVIDVDAERIAAHRNSIPVAVWSLLVFVAAAGCLTSSYGAGAQRARSFFTSAFLPLLITIVIVLIFDLMHTHQGMVSISQQPLLDLQQTIGREREQ